MINYVGIGVNGMESGPIVRYIFIAISFALVLLFQNCTQDLQFKSSQQQSSTATIAAPASQSDRSNGGGYGGYDGGNGLGGYDGKLYGEANPNRACADGDLSRARILRKSSSEFLLTREACKDLARPRAVTVVDQGATIVYSGRIFSVENPRACPAGQTAVPDHPGRCANVLNVHAGKQIAGQCGANIPDLDRCYSAPDPDPVAGCYADYASFGTCIEGYNCPEDSYPGQMYSRCNGKTFDAANPGPRCVPAASGLADPACLE